MPVHISLDTQKRGIILACTGVVNGQDIIDTNVKIYADTRAVYQLWDFRQAERVEVSAQEMHVISIQDNSMPLASALKCVAIVGEVKGLAEAYEKYKYMSEGWVGRRTGFVSEYFATREDAMVWVCEIIGNTCAFEDVSYK